MDLNNVLGEVLEKGQSVVKNSGKTAVNSVGGLAKAAVGQVAGDSNSQVKDNGSVSDQQAVIDKAQNDELVKELYAPSAPQNGQKSPSVELQSETEEQAKLASVRQKLHDEVYYQPLIQRSKSQEERPAEKVEKEKKQEMQDLQKKEAEKPALIAVQRAQQTAEKFRGMSG